jgi:hypothetical protein
MRVLIYHGPGQKSWDEVPDPVLRDDTDAIVQVDAVTIWRLDPGPPHRRHAGRVRSGSLRGQLGVPRAGGGQ